MDKFVFHVLLGKYLIQQQNYVNALKVKDGMGIIVHKFLNVQMVKNGMFIHILVNVL